MRKVKKKKLIGKKKLGKIRYEKNIYIFFSSTFLFSFAEIHRKKYDVICKKYFSCSQSSFLRKKYSFFLIFCVQRKKYGKIYFSFFIFVFFSRKKFRKIKKKLLKVLEY
jgi:hypothetical protein